MAPSAVARRYAKALFELARDEERLEAVREQAAEVAQLLEQHPDLRRVLLQPLHPVRERRAVLDAVLAKLDCDPLLRRFLILLLENRRFIDFDAIRDELERLADAAAGRRKAQVRSAVPLDEAQRERLREALSRRVGSRLELEVEQDASLLGGVVAQVGDLVFDGSLKSHLTRLRESLARG